MVNDLWISLVIAVLADYRISRMVAIEEGPFEIFLNLRGWLYDKFPKGPPDKLWVANGLTCPVCLSFWFSIPFAVLLYYQLHLDWYAILWLWLALSGAVTFLYKLEK